MAKTKKEIWKVGRNYMIRTVTMIQVGTLVYVGDDELVLKYAAWVADTGRFSAFLKDGTASEIEPFPDGEVIVGRHSIIDACEWKHALLRTQK